MTFLVTLQKSQLISELTIIISLNFKFQIHIADQSLAASDPNTHSGWMVDWKRQKVLNVHSF